MGHLPMGFLTGYADQAGLHWPQFLSWAEIICPSTQHHLAVETAQRLFTAIAHHFDAVQGHLTRT